MMRGCDKERSVLLVILLLLLLPLLLVLLLVQSLLPGGEGCRHGCISRSNHRQRSSALRLEGFEETVDLIGASAVVGLLVPYLAVDCHEPGEKGGRRGEGGGGRGERERRR